MICLDGAGWNVMMPIIKDGALPNIKRLMDNGCWGNLNILMPPISEIVWTTITTGKPPSIHGITDQLVKDPDTAEMVYPTSNLRRVKAIWNILSDLRKKVGIVGYKVSWPAEKVNGVMISDRADEDENYYFSQLYSEPPLVNLFTKEIFNSLRKKIYFPVMLMDGDNIFHKDTFMFNVTKYLLKNKEFDFFCIYLLGIDVYSHHYWKYMFPEGQDVSEDDISKYKDVIRNYYIWCDSIIGDLLKIIDKNTIIIVVSDHGFKTNYYRERKYFFSKVDELLEVTGLKKIYHNSKSVMIENTPPMAWRHIKNIKISGDISMEEFNAVRKIAKDILEDIKVKETDQSIFGIPNDTDFGFLLELDMGYINEHPTYHLLINGKEHKILDFLIPDPNSGDHDALDAIILMSGKNIRLHQKLTNATVYDIAPTVLYLLDLPVAADMYGKVLMSAIDLNILDKKPIRYIYTYEENKKPISQKPIRSPRDEKIIKERLRSLGYIN
jgi:predicted AlkP superfamily phosphohydrolase/phosphomutase